MVGISGLLSPFNFQIFGLLIDEPASVRDLAVKVGCSPAKITQFVGLFSKWHLLVVIKSKNRKIISLDKSNPLARELVLLVFISKILGSRAFNLLKKHSFSIGVFGSVVEGTVDKQSDVDLWAVLKARLGLVEAGKLKQAFSSELGREVSLKLFSIGDVKRLKSNDKIFFNELDCKSRVLYGVGFGENQG